MNDSTRRWVLGIVVGLLLVGLIGFARGTEHQRGEQIGVLSEAGTQFQVAWESGAVSSARVVRRAG